MIRPYVYVSCPMTVGQDILNEVEKKIQDEYLLPGWQVKSWKRGTQYEESIRSDARIMVVTLSNLDWGKARHEISSGSYKEITAAHKEGQPIYIAYRKMDGEIKFYSADIDHNAAGEVINIRGIHGTSENFICEMLEIEEYISEEEGWDYDFEEARWMHEEGYDEFEDNFEDEVEEYIPDFATGDDILDVMAKWDADEPFKKDEPDYDWELKAAKTNGRCVTAKDLASIDIDMNQILAATKVYEHPQDLWMRTGIMFFDPIQKEEKSLEINKPLLIGRLK